LNTSQLSSKNSNNNKSSRISSNLQN
jgi:hypothetical protein